MLGNYVSMNASLNASHSMYSVSTAMYQRKSVQMNSRWCLVDLSAKDVLVTPTDLEICKPWQSRFST